MRPKKIFGRPLLPHNSEALKALASSSIFATISLVSFFVTAARMARLHSSFTPGIKKKKEKKMFNLFFNIAI